jgi:hemerythrin superfamily protein
MTNVVPQTNDVVSIISEQHAQVRQLIGTIKAAAPDARANPFRELAGMLHAHETAEQSVVYPAIRELGDEGERVAQQRITEEEQASQVLTELEATDASTPEFEESFTAFSGDVEQHARSEEAEVLPLLETFDDARREELGDAFVSTQTGTAQ